MYKNVTDRHDVDYFELKVHSIKITANANPFTITFFNRLNYEYFKNVITLTTSITQVNMSRHKRTVQKEHFIIRHQLHYVYTCTFHLVVCFKAYIFQVMTYHCDLILMNCLLYLPCATFDHYEFLKSLVISPAPLWNILKYMWNRDIYQMSF